MPIKYILTNQDESKRMNLSLNPKDEFSVGRIPQISLQILNGTVSKNHAIIYFLTRNNLSFFCKI